MYFKRSKISDTVFFGNFSSFLYAHISYLWEGMGPCLVLFSLSKDEDAFFGCASVRQQIEEQMCSYKRHLRLKEALTHPDAFSLKQVGFGYYFYGNIWNFPTFENCTIF